MPSLAYRPASGHPDLQPGRRKWVADPIQNRHLRVFTGSMTTAGSRVRRIFARFAGSPRPGPAVRSTIHATPPITVPVTVRAQSDDDAELRIMLDAVVAPAANASIPPDLERLTHALLVPAVERWVRQRSLASFQDNLNVARAAFEDNVRPEFAGLGATLLRLDLVAVEHLLVSPSARSDEDHADDPTERGD